jgi:PKD repeat protein
MDAPGRRAARFFFAVVLLAALFGAVAPARAYTVRTQHPRIWLSPDVLTRLRAQAAANDTRWLALKNTCDAVPDASWEVGVMDYALAYQISGNMVYADKAITLMQAWVDAGIDAVTADSGYPVRTVLPGMAIGYDWCYDRLTPLQRSQFRAQMEVWADWVWPETNPSRATAWAVNNAGDNYFHSFMMTWMVGLALAGESSKATGYIDMGLQRWSQMVLPYLDQYAAGGYLMEGTSYGAGSTFRMFWYLSAHASATGEDLLNAPGVTWPRQAMLCKLHLTAPTRDRQYPGGEQARTSAAALSDYDRSSALMALTQLDGTTASYAKWWLDHTTPNRNEWQFTQWEELLWYRDDIAGVDYTQTLPTAYYAPAAGWMTSRSSWATDAVQVAMICGPSRESHQDRAQNGFVIYYGAWLAALARLNSHDGLFEDAQFNNSITVGGYDQSGSQQTARVVHFGDTSRYAYFAGDAPDVFNLRVTGGNGQPVDLSLITEFRRELLFVKPNHIIVFDRVNGRDASLVKRWHLNTLTAPTLGTDTYQATVGNSTLFGKALLPLNPTLTRTPLFLGANNAQSSWRTDLAAPTGQNLDHFLNLMEVVPSSQTVPTAVAPIQTARSTLLAGQIGDQVVVFDDANPPAATVVYQTGASPAREHFVLDLAPSKWYQILEETTAGALIHEQDVQATDQGAVYFITVGTGARRITLNQLAGPPPTNQLPVARPGGPYTGSTGQTVAFDGSASTDPDGSLVSYQWDFGDGNSGNGATATHAYAGPGSYTVALTVTDNRGAAATASTTVSIVVPPPPPMLIDDFDDNTRDQTKWTLGNVQGWWDSLIPVLERNQRLEISPRLEQNGNHYSGYVSAATWDLTNAGASVEVIQVANGPTTDTELAVILDAANLYQIAHESGKLYFQVVAGGAHSATSLNYDATQHRFWRIRHDPVANTILFETSADRVTWTTQRTVARQIAITALRAELSAGTWQYLGAPGTAIFDNFRLESNTAGPPNQAPVANPGGPYSGAAGQALSFNGSASSDPDGTIASFQWSFGDGGSATGATPTYAYPASGTYTVTLTVTDNRGAIASATTTAAISLPPNQLPVANAGGPYTGTTGQAVAFNGSGSSDPDGTIAGYQWSFGDGTTGTGVTPTHSYAGAGGYTVTLTVTDNRGGTASASATATIAAPPGTLLTDDFSDNVRDSSKWVLGALQATQDSLIPVLEQNQRLEIYPRANLAGVHYNGYLSAGTQDLTNAGASVEVVQVANGATTDTELALCLDGANFYQIVCESGRLYFQAVVGGARSTTSVAYSATQHRFWRIRHDPVANTILFETSADRVTWTTQRTVARQLAITALRIELSAGTWQALGAPGTAIFDNFRLESNGGTPLNQTPVANPGGPYTGTTGQAVSFNGAGSSDADGTIASYQWSFGDATTGTGATPTHTYAAAGTYTVTLTVTDNRGGATSAGTTATIAAPPPVGAFIDDFNDNTRDASKWSFGVIQGAIFSGAAAWDAAIPVLEQNQRLEITPRANQNGDHYNGYVSTSTWNLTNASAGVEVVQIANGPTADTGLTVGIDPQNFYLMETESGRLYFSQAVGGARSSTNITYSATAHRFWRIRHDPAANTIVFETSADRVSWVAQRSVTRQLAITAIKVELTAGTWQPLSAPGTAIFDNFRLESN